MNHVAAYTPVIGIRTANPKDSTVCWYIDRMCFPDKPWEIERFDVWRGRALRLFVAESLPVGQVVGYAAIGVTESLVRIWRLAVHPHYRRRGAGRQLVGLVWAMLEHRGHLEMRVPDHNDYLPAHCLMRACGLCPVGPATTDRYGVACHLFRRENLSDDRLGYCSANA